MQEVIKEIRKFREERGWIPCRLGDLAKSVSIEAAELLEIFQWINPSKEEATSDPIRFPQMKHEIADVMIYCLEMCDDLGLDPVILIREKMAHNATRYPSKGSV